MRNYDDEEIHRLQRDVMEKKKREAMLSDLLIQKEELEKKTVALKRSMDKEQEDVERLKASSLTAFYYRATGKLEEKLSQEEREVRAAAIKYDTAAASLEAVNEDILYCQNRLLELENCDREYEEALARKAEAIKLSGISGSHKLLQLEERLTRLENQEREVVEAASVGRQALEKNKDILKDLDSAKTWSIVDMAGGSVLSDLVKYSHLNNVQSKIKSLQLTLRRFRTELADVTQGISGDIRADVGDFLHIADYVFDGFFVDWMVYDKIKNGKLRAEETCAQLEKMIGQLDRMKCELDDEQMRIKGEIQRIIQDFDLP